MPNPLYIYIKYIGFGWVGFYGISTIVGYLIPNPVGNFILDELELPCLRTVKWFEVFLSNTNNSF